MKRLVRRPIRFGAVGLLGAGLQILVLALLTDGLGAHYLVATAAAVEAAVLHNFLWHDRWTWGDRELPARLRFSRLVRFNATTGAVSILGNVLFMKLCVGVLGLHYLLGNPASMASCAILNYLVNDRLVFADLPRKARHA